MAFLLNRFGYRGIYGAAVAIPLAAVVSWYCYDYLPLIDFIHDGDGSQTYQHGITTVRYFIMLAIQVPVSVIALLRFYLLDIGRADLHKKITLVLMVSCIVGGVIWGYFKAMDQYKFLQ